MNLQKQLRKSFMGVGVMKLVSIPIGLGTSIILAQTLGPEGFGQYVFIMALVPLICLPVSGGLRQLLVKEVATTVYTKNWSIYKGALRASHVWVLLTSAFILIGYWVLGVELNLVPKDEKWSLLPIILIIVPLRGLANVRAGVIKGLGKPAFAEIPEQIIQPIILLAFIVILAWSGALDKQTAIWGQVVVAILIFVIASGMFFKIQPVGASVVAATYQIKSWKSALIPFTMLAIVTKFNAQIGIIILGLLGTDEQVSALSVAERGGQLVMMSLMIVNMVVGPYIVRAYKDNDKELLQKLARTTARGSFLIALLVAGILIIFGEPLIRLTFGEEYSKIAYWPVVIIAIGQLINAFFGSAGQLLTMSGYEKNTLIGLFTAVLCNIGLSIFLIPLFGVVGAALAITSSLLICKFILVYLVFVKLHIYSAAF